MCYVPHINTHTHTHILLQVTGELKTLREALNTADKSHPSPPHTPYTAHAVSSESEERLTELQHRLEEVTDALSLSLLVCVYVSVSHDECLSASPQACRERDELQERVTAQHDAILSLQEEAKSSSHALSAAGADASRLRSKVTQLQGMLDAGVFVSCVLVFSVCVCVCVCVCMCAGERGREQIERERRKEVQRVENTQSNLAQSTVRIGHTPTQYATCCENYPLVLQLGWRESCRRERRE